MNYQQFITIINEKTNQLLDSGTSAKIHTALKNNDTERTGLTISKEGTNISPTIYLEEYYQQYQNGREPDDIANSIVNLYHEVRFKRDWDLEQIQNFQAIKSNIAFKVIHLEKNKKLLQSIPHIPYLDLAAVFFLLLETTERGSATIMVTQDMLSFWKISLEELHQVAMENAPKMLQADFKPMQEVIRELLGKQCSEGENGENYMYVLSNQYRHLGAACIFYERVLEDIGNQIDDDFYILPSSIHEVIILPASYSLSHEELDEMIKEINQTQVSDEDVLSEHAYYFSRKTNQISIPIF